MYAVAEGVYEQLRHLDASAVLSGGTGYGTSGSLGIANGDDLTLRLNIMWVLLCAALVFLMQAGFLCVESGLARAKNSINVAIKNLSDFLLAAVGYWLVGYGLMFGASLSGLFGTSGFAAELSEPWPSTVFVFQAMFVGTAATIVGGAIAERARFAAYLACSAGISMVIYPVYGHWAWGGVLDHQPHGWLERLHFHDFAGSSVVHVVGGFLALAAARLVGPRIGRFDENGKPVHLQASSIQTVYLGVLVLFFGWFGFNCGSTLEASLSVGGIALRTMLAGCAGGLAGGFMSRWHAPRQHYSPEAIANGVLGGLVAITAGCDSVSAFAALLIGGAAGVVVYFATLLLERWRIDDVVGAFPVHGACGLWGTIAVGAFGALPDEVSRLEYVGVQSLGTAVAAGWAFVAGTCLLKMISLFTELRVSEAEELVGLNVAEHGATSGLLDLAAAMQRGTETRRYGDSIKVPIEVGTEAGDLSRCFNAMVDTIQEEHDATLSAKAHVELVLNSTGDALITLRRDGAVVAPVSAVAVEWFGTPNGRAVWQYLPFDESRGLEYRLGFEQLTEDFIPFELATDQMPKRVQFHDRHFELEHRLVQEDEHESSILLVVRDITAEVAYRHTILESQELQKIVSHIMRGSDDFLAFVKDTERALRHLGEQPSPVVRDRLLHTLKGNTACYGFGQFSSACHDLETRLAEGTATDLDLLALSARWEESLARVAQFIPQRSSASVAATEAEVRRVAEELQGKPGFETLLRIVESWLYQPTAPALARLQRLASAQAERSGKRLTVQVEDGGVRTEPDALRDVWEALIHVLRNAVDHGLEQPDERVAATKSDTGLLILRTDCQDGDLVVSIIDDGRGIDWSLVRLKARRMGLAIEDERRIDQVLFTDGFSTRDEITELSGRGIGLAAVRAAVLNAGGECWFRSKLGSGTLFRCRFPASALRVAVALAQEAAPPAASTELSDWTSTAAAGVSSNDSTAGAA